MAQKRLSILLIVIISLSMQLCLADENTYIENNTKKATESTEQAMFTVYRVTCLMSSGGKKGLKACKQAIAINPNDTAVNNKKDELVQALKPPSPRPQPKPQVVAPPSPVMPMPVPVIPEPRPIVKQVKQRINEDKNREKLENIEAIKEIMATEEKRVVKKPEPKPISNQKRIIKQVQTLLKQLQFNIGVPDGVAGKRTQKAVRRFKKMRKISLNSKIDNSLLVVLQKAQLQHAIADEIYNLTLDQYKEGRLEAALMTVEKGLEKAPWHKRLKAFKYKIRQKIALKKEQKQKNNPNNPQKMGLEQTADKSKENKRNKKSTVKRADLLASIEEKQEKISLIEAKISMEQLVLSMDAQRTLEKVVFD